MDKKRNNKGFSLVELIVVVAIMAVLVGVLAPAYLKYVENSRQQKDVSAVGEVVQAIKIAAADEDVAKQINAAGATGVTVTLTDGAVPSTSGALATELKSSIGTVNFDSTAIASGADIVVSTDATTGALVIDVDCKTTGYTTALDSLDENVTE